MSEDRPDYKRLGAIKESQSLDDKSEALKIKGEHDVAAMEKIVRALGSDEMLGAILGEIGPASKSKRARA